MTPSISYSNNPSFEEYYDTYIIDANGNTAEYTRFQGGLYGSPGKIIQVVLGLSIQNTQLRQKSNQKIQQKLN